MAITVTHKFTSTKGDGSDLTLVRPSNWNDTHAVNLATQTLMGRMTAGTGPVEEIPATSFMAGLLASPSLAALAAVLGLPTTGDAKLTFKVTADVGWVMANDGTIGDGFSNATVPNDLCVNLFTLFFNTFPDAVAPVQTASGAATTRAAQGSASSAWGAHCRMMLPKQLGRALIIAGSGAELTPRNLGAVGGEENHTLTTAESVSHTHPVGASGTATGVNIAGTFSGSGGGSTSANSVSVSGSISGTVTSFDINHRHYVSGYTDNSAGLEHGHHMDFYTENSGGLEHAHHMDFNTEGGGSHHHAMNTNKANYPVNPGFSQFTLNLGVGGGENIGDTSDAGDHGHHISADTWNSGSIAHSHHINADTWNSSSIAHNHSMNFWGGYMEGNNLHAPAVTGSCSASGTAAAGTCSVSVSGSTNIASISLGASVSGTASAPAGFASAPHNVMQPFTAWNIMIRL
jgi:hypothetical protein